MINFTPHISVYNKIQCPDIFLLQKNADWFWEEAKIIKTQVEYFNEMFANKYKKPSYFC